MYRQVFLIVFAAFTIAQAAPGSRLSPQRDALDDAIEVAQKYYENLNETLIELSAGLNKSLEVYLSKARTSSAEYASLLHGQIDKAAEHYNASGSVNVTQCRTRESRIDTIYEDYVNKTAKVTNGFASKHALAYQYYLAVTCKMVKNGREAAERCDQLGNEDATERCRKIALGRFSREFNGWEVRMTNRKNWADLAIYSFNNYYPISDIVSVDKYDRKASQIVESAIKCMSKLQ